MSEETQEEIEIVKVDGELLGEYRIDDRWASGPFKHLLKMPPKSKGSRTEKIIRAYCCGEKPKNTDSDMKKDNKNVEIKCSFVNKDKKYPDNRFSFLQIRPTQEYDYILLCSFYFDGTINIYKLDKTEVEAFVEDGVFKKQHGGKRGDGYTLSYNGSMERFETFLFKKIKVVLKEE